MAVEPERRVLNFKTLDEVVAEVEQLASGEVRTTGNHTFAQIIKHLALSHDMSTGKVVGPRPPWYMRLMVRVMRPMIINDKPLKPGFNLPADAEAFFWPAGEIDVHEAITHLKESVANYKTNGALETHPVFGKMPADKTLVLNCKHAAMHLSFVHPV